MKASRRGDASTQLATSYQRIVGRRASDSGSFSCFVLMNVIPDRVKVVLGVDHRVRDDMHQPPDCLGNARLAAVIRLVIDARLDLRLQEDGTSIAEDEQVWLGVVRPLQLAQFVAESSDLSCIA